MNRVSVIALALAALASAASPGAAGTQEPPPAASAAAAPRPLTLRRAMHAAAERAVAEAEKRGDPAALAAALVGLGEAEEERFYCPGAHEAYVRAEALAKGRALEAATARRVLMDGCLARLQGDAARAFQLYETALAEAVRLGDRPLQARALNQLAAISHQQGQLERAMALLEESLAIERELGNRMRTALVLNNLGRGRFAAGRPAEAVAAYEETLAIAREIGDSLQVAWALNSLGTVAHSRAEWAAAVRYYGESLPILEEIGGPIEVAHTSNNLGIVHYLQGNHELAAQYFERSLALLEQGGDRETVHAVLNNLAKIYKWRGETERALATLERGLRLAEEAGSKQGIATTWHSIGRHRAARGQVGEALAAFERGLAVAEELGDKSITSQALADIAGLEVARGRFDDALRAADRAALLAAEIESPEALWNARTAAGRALAAAGRRGPARQALEEAVAVLEEIREQVAGGEIERQRFFERRIAPYHLLVELAVAEGRPADALAWAERARARVLLDALATGRARPEAAMTPAERAREAELERGLAAANGKLYLERTRPSPGAARLAELEAERARLRREREAFDAALHAAHPELAARHHQPPPLAPGDLAGLLPDGAALVEYAVLPDRTHLFVVAPPVTGGDPAVDVFKIEVPQAELERLVGDFRQRLAGRNLDFRAGARRLHDLLLGPAREALAGRRTLAVVPDGPLWELPFQALAPSERTFLAEERAVFYAPSAGVLAAASRLAGERRRRPAERALFAVGNPLVAAATAEQVRSAHRGVTLGPLPDAEAEVAALAGLYGAERSTVVTGAAAAEARIKVEAGRHRVLHFATHGILDDREPLYSNLVVAPGGDGAEDGLVEAWELMRLDLDADLVVLSACQTARGRVGAGEGMIGLAWALLVAGSPATIASQWEVDSAATSRLMVELHRRLLAGSPKAQALREASLALMKDERYRHPFYWAGFVLVGDGG